MKFLEASCRIAIVDMVFLLSSPRSWVKTAVDLSGEVLAVLVGVPTKLIQNTGLLFLGLSPKICFLECLGIIILSVYVH